MQNNYVKKRRARVKKTLFWVALFFLLFFLYKQSAAAEPDWIYFDFSLAKDFLYIDRANISRPYPSYDIFRVHQKTVYKNRTVNITADRRGKTYNNLRESIEIIDIYCSKKKYLSRSITFYDADGEMIEKTDNFDSNYWVSIPPDTSLETLFRMVCTEKKNP
jgi:hypothetical protein